MKKKSILVSILSILVVIGTFSFCVYENNKSKLVDVVTNVTEDFSAISNKKICWGIKRSDNHEQPDVGKENNRIIDKYNGMCLGNSEKKYLYLTFDAGYEAGYTEKIIEVLKENNVKGTFFITGHYLNTTSELVQKMIENGNTVGNHTVNHKSMPSLTEEKVKSEIMELHQTVNEKFGYELKFIRPPMGEFSEKTLNITSSLGYKTVMWSFAYKDWDEKSQPQLEDSKKKVLDNVHNGEIMLLHANSKTNTEKLDSIIKEIKNMGYEFKSLDQFEK